MILSLPFLLSGVLSFSGRLTYFDPGLGACGGTNSGSDYIVAMNQAQYSGTCGDTLCVSYGGRSTTVRVVDLCPSCPHGALDASPSVFRHLVGSLGPGVVQVSWNWGGCGNNNNDDDSTSSRRSSQRSSSTQRSTSTRRSSSTRSSSQRSSSTQRSTSSRRSSSTLISTTVEETSTSLEETTTAEETSTSTAYLPLSQRTACYISN